MITIRNLYKSFNHKTIFKNLNFEIQAGEMVAIMGRSGSGKTTLLNIIGSLEPFDSGEVIVNDVLMKKFTPRHHLQFLRYKVSYLFQDYALMGNKTVNENLSIVLPFTDDASLTIKEALKLVNLDGYENSAVNILSGGEQQRVALARTLIKASEIILADEPTGNLDKQNADNVWKILRQLKRKGKTIIVVTHDQDTLDLFDRVIILD